MTDADIQKIIDGMTIDQKIGQMFLGDVAADEPLESVKRNFEKNRPGGFEFSAVFQRLVRGGDYIPCGVARLRAPDQKAEFLWQVRKAAREIIGIPTMAAVGQEGGMENSHFRASPVVVTPNAMGIGAIDSPDDAYTAGRIASSQVKAVGIDQIFGPCLGVNTNPRNPEIAHRSLGDDPARVTELGEQILKAYRDNGIIATAKHFPGRGHGGMNAHSELEVIDVDRAHLDAYELPPFKRAIARGVPTVMTAHTIYPGFGDSELPASLSPVVIQRVLREELGFEGVIFPDDITMFAISNNFEIPIACATCIAAGSDMILMKVNDLIVPAIEKIKEYMLAGKISEEQINASLVRILKMKRDYGLFDIQASTAEAAKKVVGSKALVEAGADLARKAVLVARNEDNVLPLKCQAPLIIVPRELNVVVANDPDRYHDMLERCLQPVMPRARTLVVDVEPTEHQRYESLAMARDADLVLFAIYGMSSIGSDAETGRGMMGLLDFVLEQGKPVVVLLTGVPYAAGQLPRKVKAVVCSFGISPYAFAAAANVMLGNQAPHGKLPVKVPGLSSVQ
jgi:beta-N-acetylhexosaminidase